MARRRKHKRKGPRGHIPLEVLEKRLYHLNQTVKNRGGTHYTKYRA
jgi:hypothetical protein